VGIAHHLGIPQSHREIQALMKVRDTNPSWLKPYEFETKNSRKTSGCLATIFSKVSAAPEG
jgi:hypothetical protein